MWLKTYHKTEYHTSTKMYNLKKQLKNNVKNNKFEMTKCNYVDMIYKDIRIFEFII